MIFVLDFGITDPIMKYRIEFNFGLTHRLIAYTIIIIALLFELLSFTTYHSLLPGDLIARSPGFLLAADLVP